MATKKPAYSTAPLREQQLAKYGAGKALGRVNAARDTLHAAARIVHDDVVASRSSPSWPTKFRVQLAASFAAEACAEAVRLVNDVAGSTSFREGAPFERHFRDVHTLLQHASKANPRDATAGRLLFGLENRLGPPRPLNIPASEASRSPPVSVPPVEDHVELKARDLRPGTS